jgi:hypothetical protein
MQRRTQCVECCGWTQKVHSHVRGSKTTQGMWVSLKRGDTLLGEALLRSLQSKACCDLRKRAITNLYAREIKTATSYLNQSQHIDYQPIKSEKPSHFSMTGLQCGEHEQRRLLAAKIGKGVRWQAPHPRTNTTTSNGSAQMYEQSFIALAHHEQIITSQPWAVATVRAVSEFSGR